LSKDQIYFIILSGNWPLKNKQNKFLSESVMVIKGTLKFMLCAHSILVMGSGQKFLSRVGSGQSFVARVIYDLGLNLENVP